MLSLINVILNGLLSFFRIMTCILSMMPIFSNPCLGYCEEGSEVLDELDGPWVGARTPGTPETMRCSTPCRIEASTVTGTRYDMASSSKVHITENKRAEESYPKNKPLADSISADVENSLHEVTKCKYTMFCKIYERIYRLMAVKHL